MPFTVKGLLVNRKSVHEWSRREVVSRMANLEQRRSSSIGELGPAVTTGSDHTVSAVRSLRYSMRVSATTKTSKSVNAVIQTEGLSIRRYA